MQYYNYSYLNYPDSGPGAGRRLPGSRLPVLQCCSRAAVYTYFSAASRMAFTFSFFALLGTSQPDARI